MRAFVLSGGANYGALQAGALQVLLERGIYPDMLVGTSAGALNAAWLAIDPTLEGASQLERVWRQNAARLYQPPGGLLVLLRLLQSQDGVLPNEPLLRLICKMIPPETTFGDLSGLRLFVVAVRLHDGWLRVFGDQPQERLVDALMASTALPPVFPPWVMDNEAYVDGGLLSNLPLQAAVDRGAKEIYALDTSRPITESSERLPHGMVTVATRSILLMHEQLARKEISSVQENRKVRLHYLPLKPRVDPGFWNFSMAQELVMDGRRDAEAYLAQKDAQRPRELPAWLGRILERFSAIM